MNTAVPDHRPRVALIAGPTASGKSALAIALAERARGTIVNCDASQVYRDLRILTARPSAADEARVPHRLYGYRDGAEPCSAAEWAADARRAVADILAQGRLPILVGGTGLYIRTLLDGIAPIPEVPADIRAAVRALATPAAYAALEREDPAAAAALHANDTARIQRALEVVRATGRSIAAWRRDRAGGIARDLAIDVRIVDPPIDELYARCDARVDAMIAAGAADEVAVLTARRLSPDLPVMRAIGVAPLRALAEGEGTRDTAIATIKQATRNYAKRQRTWFRNQPLNR